MIYFIIYGYVICVICSRVKQFGGRSKAETIKCFIANEKKKKKSEKMQRLIKQKISLLCVKLKFILFR